MGAVALALLTAVSYGTSDFIGGLLSKSRSAWAVAALSFVAGVPISLLAALVVGGDPGIVDFAWGVGAGIGEGVGIGALYHGLSKGRMTVVAPISGIGPVLIPAAVGLAIGEVPSALAWVGIALAFPAIYLIPRAPAREEDDGRESSSADLAVGLIAALGFGAQFALIGQIDLDAGLFPIVAVMLAAAAAVVVIATAMHEPWLPERGDWKPLIPGALSATAVISFTLATRLGLLAVVSVVSALYPATTVILAAAVLKERLGRVQLAGLGLAALAVVLVTLG